VTGPDDRNLTGRVAIVTGGASGMGAATALRLAAHGASVVVTDVNELGHQVVAKIVETGGAATFHHVDVSDPASVQAGVDRTLAQYGRLDMAANIAGIPQNPTALTQTSLELWDKIHGVNDRGLFVCLRAEIPAMLETGGGAIVNVSSINGLRSFPQMTAYGSSKFGAVSTTMAVAAEFAAQGVRVNGIAPGSIDTPMLAGLPPETLEHFKSSLPMRRLGTADEVAKVATFLLSDDASYVTGAIVPVDGGWMVSP
jgi:NAD(P)-dependent dehydrogenase (short-subunit alcohol dehydrogenase family)